MSTRSGRSYQMSEEEGDVCCYCLDSTNEPLAENICDCKGSNKYHLSCVRKQIKESSSFRCPTCKAGYFIDTPKIEFFLDYGAPIPLLIAYFELHPVFLLVHPCFAILPFIYYLTIGIDEVPICPRDENPSDGKWPHIASTLATLYMIPHNFTLFNYFSARTGWDVLSDVLGTFYIYSWYFFMGLMIVWFCILTLGTHERMFPAGWKPSKQQTNCARAIMAIAILCVM